MESYLQKFDALAGIETSNARARWLERAAFFFLVLMIVSAPHSIAATQIAWLTGMFLWVVRLFFKPRPKLFRTPLDIALWGFFAWSVITSLTSYAPLISLNRLRGTALFLIFYFVIYNLRNARAVRFAACALVFSCMVNVIWVPVQRLIGRGVEIHGVASNSPLSNIYLDSGDKAALYDGDTLLTADNKKLSTPDDLIAALEEKATVKLKFYRPDFDLVVTARRADLLPGSTATERLGITGWKKSHNWRSSGFYGHYATYAEVLQLIASLTLGLFLAAILRRKKQEEEKGRREVEETFIARSPRLPFSPSPLLLICLGLMSLALLLTVTRASQLGFLISAAAVLFAGGNRKLLLVSAAIILPIAIGGLVFLQQSRQVGFFDPNDDSIKYRQTMYRDGVRLWTSEPRHLLLGVGMDSIQKYWREWGLFDEGRMAMGHFHSTLLQLLVERGIPALILYLVTLGIYARSLWRAIKLNKGGNWMDLGILLGCFGGGVGFFAASVVHYNFGDAEVLMVLFMLMGIGMKIAMSRSEPPAQVVG
jgi:hypothetical protein